MKHSSNRALYAHWDHIRGSRVAPERRDIDPAAIRSALGDSFILEFNEAAGHPFRLAGTRLCALFGRELKGEAFADLWDRNSRETLCGLLAILGEEAAGVVAAVTARTADDNTATAELLLLPLRHAGDMRRRVLGALAPAAVPIWIGASPVQSLALGSFRHLGSGAKAAAAPPLVAVEAKPATPRKLVVFPGGRTLPDIR